MQFKLKGFFLVFIMVLDNGQRITENQTIAKYITESISQTLLAQSAGAVEYTDCFSAVG